MTIAFLSDGIYPSTLGGIQMHSYKLVKHLAQFKVKIDVYTSDNITSINLPEFYSKNELSFLNFITVAKPIVVKVPGHYIYRSYLYSKHLYKQIKDKGYDAIYAQGLTGWYTTSTELNPKLITNLHGLEMFQTSINFKNKLEHLLLRIPATQIIKQSHKQVSLGGRLTDILYKQGAKPKSVIELPNGITKSFIVAPASVNESDNKLLRFIFIGRYERRKAIEEINQAITELFKEGYRFHCHFIGPIPENKKLKASSQQLGAIKYHGKIIDHQRIKEELQKSDILLCPSYSEGMPTVILEAMACQCAIIATDVGASANLVSKDNGWLIQPEDIVKHLKQAIKEACQASPDDINRMGKVSQDKVLQNFTWGQIAEDTLSLCKSLNK